MEAQYGTDADEAWFVGRVMAVNAEGTCDVHYEDGDKEAGKPWARVRAAAVDAESEEAAEEAGELELEGGEDDEEDGELEKGTLGGGPGHTLLRARYPGEKGTVPPAHRGEGQGTQGKQNSINTHQHPGKTKQQHDTIGSCKLKRCCFHR